jgi:hypothetical protein
MKNLNGGVKVPGTGLVLYPGGTEKTPTGESNAFVNSGLTAEDLLSYAKKYNLPTTSNRDFQKAQYELLNSTPTGRRSLEIMQKKFGKSKAGTYVDDILGARTMAMMKNTPTIGGEEHIRIVPKEIPITPLETPKKIPDIAGLKGNYYISWPGDRSYAKENNLNHIDGYNQLPLSSYKDLEYIVNYISELFSEIKLPILNIISSPNCGPIICKPTGKSSAKPQGTEIPGIPAKEAGMV